MHFYSCLKARPIGFRMHNFEAKKLLIIELEYYELINNLLNIYYMQSPKYLIICLLLALVFFASCGADNTNPSKNNVPENQTVSDSPRANQPSGYAPPNAKGMDSASVRQNDSLQ